METTMPRRPTKDPYARLAIQTLERLHAELGGKILENKQEHANLAERMRQIESVIKMLDPGYSLRAISVKRRKPNPGSSGARSTAARWMPSERQSNPYGARDCWAGVGNGQGDQPQQGGAGGPDRHYQFVTAES
jgi:hypothetical protein